MFDKSRLKEVLVQYKKDFLVAWKRPRLDAPNAYSNNSAMRMNICSFQGHCYCRRRPIALFDDYCGSRPPLLRIKATGC